MRKIDSQADFIEWVKQGGAVQIAVVQNLDLTSNIDEILGATFCSAIFLGCDLPQGATEHIVKTGGTVIPDNHRFEFEAHRADLYSVSELFDGYDHSDINGYHKTYDYKVYDEYIKAGKVQPPIDVSLYRRLHDHGITEALDETLKGRNVVAVMGGHGMERQDPFYSKVAMLSRLLTQAGYLMVSGGGPGAMEATHLGAYFAARSETELKSAIEEIKVRVPGSPPGREYADADWLQRAWNIREKYPLTKQDEKTCMSVGIPTWFYGHEPPAPFATHIAKYFANSVREDGLLMIASHGVIFAPGSAGTTQEIFMDAAQNHYGSSGYYSPMILFGKEHWLLKRPVWPLLMQVSYGKKYGELVSLTDSEEEIIETIKAYKPEDYKKGS